MGFNDVTPKVANSAALALNSPRKKNNAVPRAGSARPFQGVLMDRLRVILDPVVISKCEI